MRKHTIELSALQLSREATQALAAGREIVRDSGGDPNDPAQLVSWTNFRASDVGRRHWDTQDMLDALAELRSAITHACLTACTLVDG